MRNISSHKPASKIGGGDYADNRLGVSLLKDKNLSVPRISVNSDTKFRY